MNVFMRWWKFNFVGAIGMAVQLGALALMGAWGRSHYLYATTAAIELTLLHNFLWHVHFTWRDRRGDAEQLTQLMRFHLSNGSVSILGNLGLMRILVGEARLPVLVSNGIAILCCSIVNFVLGEGWVFAAKTEGEGNLSGGSACESNTPSPLKNDRRF